MPSKARMVKMTINGHHYAFIKTDRSFNELEAVQKLHVLWTLDKMPKESIRHQTITDYIIHGSIHCGKAVNRAIEEMNAGEKN